MYMYIMCHQNRYVVRIVKNVLYILSDDPLIHELLQSHLVVMFYFHIIFRKVTSIACTCLPTLMYTMFSLHVNFPL